MPIDSDSVCNSCKAWVERAGFLIKSKTTKKVLIGSLELSCKLLPSRPLQKECKKVVDENFPEILKMLESAMDANAICSACLFCNNAKYDKALKTAVAKKPSIKVRQTAIDSVVKKSVNDKPLCSLCVQALQQIQDLLEKNTTVDDIVDFMDDLCDRFGGDLADQCKDLVQQNINNIVTLLINDIKPQEICTSLDFCSSELKKLKEANSVSKNLKKNKIAIDVDCTVCKQTVKTVENLFLSQKSKDKLLQKLENVCAEFYSYSDTCLNLLDEYFDQIYDFLLQEVKPDKICQLLKYCDASKEKHDYMLKLLQTMVKQMENDGDDSGCDMCKFVMTTLLADLNDPDNLQKIKDAMLGYCSLIPFDFSGTCQKMVNTYFDLAVAFLKGMAPDMICADLQFCTAAFESKKSIKSIKTGLQSFKMQGDIYTCGICVGFSTGIYTILQDQDVDQAILDSEEQLCELILGKYKDKVRKLRFNLNLIT